MASTTFVAPPDDPIRLKDKVTGQGGWATTSQLNFLENLGAQGIGRGFGTVEKLTYYAASAWITELRERRYAAQASQRPGLFDEPKGGWYVAPGATLDTPANKLDKPAAQSSSPPSASQATTMSTPQETPKEPEPVKTAEIMPTGSKPPVQMQPTSDGIAGYDRELVEVVKRDILPENMRTDADLKRYLFTCREYGFSPMKRQCYAMVAGGRLVVEVSIDGMLSLAESTGEYAGADEPVIDLDKDGKIVRATATVHRWHGNERIAITASALWEEYGVAAQSKVSEKGRAYSPWFTMPSTMIGKVALGKALRRGFPRALSGLYEHSEMDQARE